MKFKVRARRRMPTACRSRWAPVTVTLVALYLTAGVCACSSGANEASRGDVASTSSSSAKLTPEQCIAGGEIQQASLHSDEQSYVIQPGDVLSVDFYLNPEFNDEPTVRPDGKVTLRLIGDIQAAGLTPSQFAASLDKAYLSELRSPDAAVHVKSSPDRLVFVQGQVTKPGSFALEPGMTALQAVADAGGVTPEAGHKAVLIRRDICGQPHGIKVDISNAEGKLGDSEDVALMPRDILVVPRSTIANVDLFVKHYMQDILPIPPYLAIPAM
ncbi:MAG: polysaccharide biosynthesis/export family protein [Deltaproteobacteria bacterium]|nr:polysaccharide biosynthesis/export family protein [Deltaproteobacteria bacterium]